MKLASEPLYFLLEWFDRISDMQSYRHLGEKHKARFLFGALLLCKMVSVNQKCGFGKETGLNLSSFHLQNQQNFSCKIILFCITPYGNSRLYFIRSLFHSLE